MQRLLAEGRFTASYKYALLLSLADVAVERGDDSGKALTISTKALAEKFIQYYWRQSLPYLPRGRSRDGKVLQQNTDRQAKIITVLGDAHQTHGGSLSVWKHCSDCPNAVSCKECAYRTGIHCSLIRRAAFARPSRMCFRNFCGRQKSWPMLVLLRIEQPVSSTGQFPGTCFASLLDDLLVTFRHTATWP